MEIFDVTVRNELTGEVATLSIETSIAAEAQVDALVQLFDTRGWRKATALEPVCRSLDGRAEQA